MTSHWHRACLLCSLALTAPAYSAPIAPDARPAASERTLETNVLAALSAGDARRLTRLGGETLDVALDGTDGTFSQAQAEQILGTFFRTYAPTRVEKVNELATGAHVVAYYAYQSDVSSFQVLCSMDGNRLRGVRVTAE